MASFSGLSVVTRSAPKIGRGARTTHVPATRSPTRKRSLLNKGKSRKIPAQIVAKRLIQPSTPPARIPNIKPMGRKNPISRRALRAKTLAAESLALPRAATRIFNAIFPGVAARRPNSKSVKKSTPSGVTR